MDELIRFLSLEGRKIFLILDYDGTLTEIVDNPMEATLTKEQKALIEDLNAKKNISILINSGRPMDELEKISDNINIDLLANHGLFYREEQSTEINQTVEEKRLNKWDKDMKRMLEYLKESVIPKFKNSWIK